RMFGRPQNSLPALQSALATYTEQACTRMRAQHSVCSFIRVSLTPREHHAPRQYYSCALPDTTDHTASILAVAQQALKHIWRPQHFYKKVSIYLGGLIPKDQANLDLFQAARYQAQEPLTRTIDQINQRWGRGTIHSGQASYKAPWSMRRRYLSPRYTTSIDEVWTVFCHKFCPVESTGLDDGSTGVCIKTNCAPCSTVKRSWRYVIYTNVARRQHCYQQLTPAPAPMRRM